MITLSYLEFYSGIGGWGYALELACRSVGQDASVRLTEENGHPQKKPKLFGDVNSCDGNTSQHLIISTQLLAAYDHSDLCNSVFVHNHTSHCQLTATQQHKPPKPRQTPIENITKKELESHAATIWCMSPPCQPHTRQHSNQDKEMEDPRSKSFLHLCNMLNTMDEDKLPCLVLLENVVGFESAWVEPSLNSNKCATQESTASDSNADSSTSNGSIAAWRSALSLRKYEVAHFHLDPTQVGLPNNRPRYYCVAFRRGSLQQSIAKEESKLRSSLGTYTTEQNIIFSKENLNSPPLIQTEISLKDLSVNKTDSSIKTTQSISEIKNFLDADLTTYTDSTNLELSSKQKSLQIPLKVQTSSSAWCFDIITPQHTCSSCFTHSYGKYIRGTGSILYHGPLRSANDKVDEGIPSIEKFQLASPEERSFDKSWSDGINWDYMRYLSGTEIARLMGFPVSEPAAIMQHEKQEAFMKEVRMFSFPSHCTMRQQWKLLGNSLNVKVAANVAEIGINAILTDASR